MQQHMKASNEERQLRFDGFDHPYFGTGAKLIDLNEINQDEFQCKVKDGVVLVTPRQSKHRWQPSEYHLRSLLCDQRGRVLSSGLPKFLNYSEDDSQDDLLRSHIAAGNVEVSPKLDGSLIILDLINGKHLHLRTRGSHDLNEFEAPVVELIKTKYPTLPTIVMDPANRAFFAQHSVLFEYTAPTNRIVLPYEESSLTLLAYVDKGSLKPRWDAFTLTRLSKAFGCPWAKPHLASPTNADEFRAVVAAMKGVEGFVLRSQSGEPFMLKMKTEEYCLIHSVKFGFNERKVAKLAFLLNLQPEHDLLTVLARFGLDAECVTVLTPWFDAYFARLAEAEGQYSAFVESIETVRTLTGEDRKDFVERIKRVIANREYPNAFFPAAMKMYEYKWEEARLCMLAYVLDESVGAIRQWIKDKDVELSGLFKGEVVDA